MRFQVVDAKKYPLKDEDCWILAEIETHPKVQEWDTDIHANNKSSMHHLFRKFLEALPNDRNQIFLVGMLEGKIIGFLGIHRKSRRMKHIGIVGISVHPDYWSKGFGSELLKVGIEQARKERFLRLEADTLAKNKAMIRIAEKVGFKLEGVRRKRIKIGKVYGDEALLGLILT